MAAPKEYRLHTLAWRELEEADVRYFTREYDISVEFLALAAISDAPHRWPKYLHGTRRLVMQRFPFSVVYLDDPELVTIVAIAHNKRKPGYWKDRV